MPKAYRLRIQNRRRRYQAGSKGRQPFERPSREARSGSKSRAGRIWPVGQAVKTPASHAGNAGSIPARVTNLHSRGDWKRGCHSAKQSQTASFAKRNSLGRSRRDRSCVTNLHFPHTLPKHQKPLRLLIIQPVIMTLRIHLFPFRTQKLSSAVPKILGG